MSDTREAWLVNTRDMRSGNGWAVRVFVGERGSVTANWLTLPGKPPCRSPDSARFVGTVPLANCEGREIIMSDAEFGALWEGAAPKRAADTDAAVRRRRDEMLRHVFG